MKMLGRQNESERASPSIRNFCGGLKSSTEMSPTEKGGQSRTDDGQNFLPELESVEWSEEGSECGKTDRFVKVELVGWKKGESCPLSHDGTRTESELCQLGQSGC